MAGKKKSSKAKPAKKKSPVKKRQTKAKVSNSPFTKVASGQPNWFGLSTTDDQAAANFYGKVLGHGQEKMTMGNQSMIMLKAGGNQIAHIDSVEPGGSPRWIIFFYVPDVDKAAKLCADNGGQIVMAPGDIPPGRVAFLKDPAGAEFALFKPRG